MLHTPAVSPTGLSVGEAASAAYSPRGASAHHATGSPRRYASRPGAAPERTQARNARFRSSGVMARKSRRRSRQNMHQQFEYAPFGPNRRSRSCQRADVAGLISSGIDREAGAERLDFAGDALEVRVLVRVVEH